MANSRTLDGMPKMRRDILIYIKRHTSATISEMGHFLGSSLEAVRQQLLQLELAGLVERRDSRPADGQGPGRPSKRYFLTTDGENLFPKRYEALGLELMDAIEASCGADGLDRVLESLVESKVRTLKSSLGSMTEEDKGKTLQQIYFRGDDFLRVEFQDGTIRSIIEENCPFLEVALRRPGLCTVTLSVLSRLLGTKVVREESFQNGDGRCVFRVFPHEQVNVP